MGREFWKAFKSGPPLTPGQVGDLSREHLNQVLNCAAAMVVTDTAGRIVEVNDRFCQI